VQIEGVVRYDNSCVVCRTTRVDDRCLFISLFVVLSSYNNIYTTFVYKFTLSFFAGYTIIVITVYLNILRYTLQVHMRINTLILIINTLQLL
jgi:hypothetical protein